MAKIPVTKTVTRNGQTHTQTYWEEDDKKSSGSSRLAGLGISLPPQPQTVTFPTDLELENQWRVIMGDLFSTNDDAQAAIAAGLTFGAAQYLSTKLPEGTSLSDYIYQNGLDQHPRPKGGWSNKDGVRSADQKAEWENSKVPLDEAVRWIDAGFHYPTSNVLWARRAGVSLERAAEWGKGLGAYPRDAMLAQAMAEFRSEIPYEDARQWRAEFHGSDSICLSEREVSFYGKGFTPSQAKRWNEVCYEDVDIDSMIALKDLKWSPSTLKAVSKFTGRGANKINWDDARQLIESTPKVGNQKLVNEWLPVAVRNSREAMFSDEFVRELKEVEALKQRASSVYGISLSHESNRDLFELSAPQRETLLMLMDDNSRFLDTSQRSVWKASELARFISSPENLSVLKDHGFVFTDPESGTPYNVSLSTEKYNDFDATTADKHSRDEWMKSLSLRLYSTLFRSQDSIDRWASDDSIDPVKLRKVLMDDPRADDVRLEALLVANVAQPVADGWL